MLEILVILKVKLYEISVDIFEKARRVHGKESGISEHVKVAMDSLYKM